MNFYCDHKISIDQNHFSGTLKESDMILLLNGSNWLALIACIKESVANRMFLVANFNETLLPTHDLDVALIIISFFLNDLKHVNI